LAIAFVYFLTTRFDLDWETTWGNVRAMDPRLYALAFLLYYLSFGFRGLRWRILARNAGLHDLPGARLPSALTFAQLILIGWFANSVAPLRLGDAYRAYAFSRVSRGNFSWSLGTVLAERAVDMVIVLALVLVGFGLFAATRDTSGAGFVLVGAIAMFVALGVVLGAMKGYGARLARFLPERLEPAYHRFHKGTLGGLRQLPLVFGLGLVGWLLEASRLYFVVQALDLTIGLPLVLIVALGHAVLSTVPTPGGVGVVEPGLTGLLVLSMASGDAVSIVLVDRSITYLSVIALGGLAFLVWQATNARKERTDSRLRGSVAQREGVAKG
jgi:uncharacterized protein (TIRG00374 family)